MKKKQHPQEKELTEWVEALRSEKFKQARGNMQVGDKFCCLGVACILNIPKKERLYRKGKKLYGLIPAHQPKAPEWLKKINLLPDLVGRNKFNEVMSLSQLNDDGYNFNEIADIIQIAYLYKGL